MARRMRKAKESRKKKNEVRRNSSEHDDSSLESLNEMTLDNPNKKVDSENKEKGAKMKNKLKFNGLRPQRVSLKRKKIKRIDIKKKKNVTGNK